MISRYLYLNIVFRVAIIVTLSILLGFLIINVNSLRISLVFAILVVALSVNLISYLNSINRKISFFFNSVKNDDSSLSFPYEVKNKTIKDIYRSMNLVNQQIKQLKIENSNQEQYFQILLEHLATGIITYNDKGFIQHANSTAKTLLSTEVLTHLQQIERIDMKLYQAIKNIKPLERRLIAFNSGEEEIQLSLKATSFKTVGQEMVVLSIQDIKNELDEKELESWMKLIRVLMHEIMNSITPITSLSESLSNIYSNDGNPVLPEQINSKTIATTLQGLNVIKEQGRGLMSFVESYRRLTRMPEPDKKIFRVVDLLNRVNTLYNSLELSKGIELSLSVKDQNLCVFADQNQISQVLINLLKNALEANINNPSCKIIISAGRDKDNNPEICVIDNGPGISEENLDEIFVPFFTTRKNGSGIGLSISRQIMKAHAGTLKVRSVPNCETIFCLSFQS
jgi:two-component system, NtrC family, nitrogen regulation sensor histidine kinase NtrY